MLFNNKILNFLPLGDNRLKHILLCSFS